MAEEYQFHLARWNERDKHLKCPGCGRAKGCFKEYVDANGNPVDCEGHTVGKCDHETSCGYHLTPKEWFKAGGKVDLNLPKRPAKDVRFISIENKSLVGQFHKHTKQVGNSFLKWVESLPLTDEQRKCLPMLIDLYAIGTTRDGRIIWWQIDENRNVRDGKIMAYDNTGHRCKDEEGNAVGFSWVHTQLQRTLGMFKETETVRYKMNQCLFGQHLLPICPEADVHVVESEKTAFLMSIFDPEAMGKNIWLACGGLYNLKNAAIVSLNGRNVYCYPDMNGIDRWKEALKGTHAKLSTGWMSQWKSSDGDGADIADVVLRKMLMDPEAKLQRMQEQNPNLTTLIYKLNLDLVK